ncbi:MAG: LysR family transcriptional regulator [Aquabacterium sp.]|nr:MAG: LysR family transcriptional regulator [Aquabacterium sp.]
MDRFEAMRVFTSVAEAGGFAAGARRLRMSPPAVTRAIAALERHIGVPLFKRTTRLVRLTEAGERYLADCRRILLDLEEAEAQAGGAHAEPRGLLTVTAPVQFGRLHVAPLLLDFLDRHPGLTARAFFVDRIVHLLDEGFDVALRIAHLPDSSLTAVRVGSVRRVIVAAPDYLARHGEPLHPGELARHRAVGTAPGGGAAGPWRFPQEPGGQALQEFEPPRVALTANSGDIAINAAIAGHGLSRAMSYQVAAEVEAGRLRIVLAGFEPPRIPVHLVYPEGRKAAAKVRAFVDFAAQRLRAHPVLGAVATD